MRARSQHGSGGPDARRRTPRTQKTRKTPTPPNMKTPARCLGRIAARTPQTAKMAPPAPANGAAALLAVSGQQPPGTLTLRRSVRRTQDELSAPCASQGSAGPPSGRRRLRISLRSGKRPSASRHSQGIPLHRTNSVPGGSEPAGDYGGKSTKGRADWHERWSGP